MQSSHILFGRSESRPERISTALGGAAPSRASEEPSISGDGRVVAFASDAPDLVPDDTNHVTDVFVWESGKPGVTRASVSSEGGQGNEVSRGVRLSADGRVVVFQSRAGNLAAGNHDQDVFVRDLAAGTTTCVSLAPDGTPGDGRAAEPAISADGRFVAFSSSASNLVEGDTNAKTDVFLHDRATGATQRVSVASDGGQGNGASEQPVLSADGRFVAFSSCASNFVAGDANGVSDVFVRDVATGSTECVSLGLAGGTADLGSTQPSISGDGRLVAFQSSASDLVPSSAAPLPTGLKPSHVYVHDRETRATRRIDAEVFDGRRMGDAYRPVLSADGRFVVYQAMAARMSHDDDPDHWQIFVSDLETGDLVRLGGADPATPANGHSTAAAISADGSWIAFSSSATNLVEGERPRAASVYRVPNPSPRAQQQRVATEAATIGQEPAAAPSIESGQEWVVINGVRVPIRTSSPSGMP